MGGLRAFAAATAGLVALAAPATVEVKGRLPGGGHAAIRLVFRQGVQVEAPRLPRRFLAARTQDPEQLQDELRAWLRQGLEGLVGAVADDLPWQG